MRHDLEEFHTPELLSEGARGEGGGSYGNERFESSKAFVRERNNRIVRNNLKLDGKNIALVLKLHFK